MAPVTLKSVTKSYGATPVLHGIDIDIADGEFVVLVGPSGCGKSTLLRMIAGLETITGGDVSIGDRVVNHLEPKDRDIAMVFQNYALYPHMTVATNMGFSLEHRGASKAEISERVNWAADILGLKPLLDRYPRQLSGGQRQRVAMGRAIVRNPQVFLFDEPLSNLDAKLRVVMRGEIKGLHQRLGVTTVYVTHDQVEAMTMADKIVVMNGGRVEQIGAPLDLYDRPANLFVAGFIGSPAMNTLGGRITAEGFVAAGVTLPLPAGIAAADNAIYGIRPEHLSLAESGIPAIVKLVEPMGSETQVTMSVGEHSVIAMFRERLAARSGDAVHLQADLKALHLFDATTGDRLKLMYPETAFTRALANGAFPVIVSLPRHDMALAEAALEAGAFAIKTHLNAYHRASGTTFGGFAEERPFFEQLAKLGCPLLVMAGQETVPTTAEMDALADLGFEGFNVYIDHLQPHLLQSRLRPMPALAAGSSDADLDRIAAIPGCIIEASVMTFDRYGTALGDADLDRYRHIAQTVSTPVIVPSQLKLTPTDMPRLRAAGVAAPLLGVVVTGAAPQSMRAAVRDIVSAIAA